MEENSHHLPQMLSYLIPISCSLLLASLTSVHCTKKKEIGAIHVTYIVVAHSSVCLVALRFQNPLVPYWFCTESYLEGDVIIFGIDRTRLNNGVELIDCWILDQMYANAIIVQPAQDQSISH